MKTLAAAAIAALSLGACVSLPQRDKLDGPPSQTHQSAKAPRVVADCIAAEWRKIRAVGTELVIDVAPVGTGWRVTQKLGPSVSRVAQVDAQGSGSATKFWNLSMDFGATAPPVLAVGTCQ
ncbi:MAG: hypothetical protein JNM33_02445 [Rubrivivax sp.]|nr:hypothetical protein [Rubrivivax sp.]